MKLTKYKHACFTLEESGKLLVVDPGSFNDDLGVLDNIAAIVVTHIHFDHFSAEKVNELRTRNPDLTIFTTKQVADELGSNQVRVVTDGQEVTAGPFKLQFFGELHAVNHPSMPQDQNVGVVVNDTLYFPGDSFTKPSVPVQVLAIPISGPWVKLGDVIDFFNDIAPTKACFPVHESLLSDIGINMVNNWLTNTCKERGISFFYLKSGETSEV